MDASGDELAEEFDTLPEWIATVVEELGPAYAVPAACQGSGTPASLTWLVEQMGLGAGSSLLDCGAGLGGPAELVAHHFGVEPVLVDPMEGACRAAQRLFDRPGLVADGSALPFASGSFAAAWALGVLSTVENEGAVLDELARTVRPRGSVGLLVYVRTAPLPLETPAGTSFPTVQEVLDLVDTSGLVEEHRAWLSDFDDPSRDWCDLADEVEDVVRRRWGRTTPWKTAQQQRATLSGLLERGDVSGLVLACRRTSSSAPSRRGS